MQREADGEGFEPPVQLPVRRFSKPVPLTAQPPILLVLASMNRMPNTGESGFMCSAIHSVIHPIEFEKTSLRSD